MITIFIIYNSQLVLFHYTSNLIQITCVRILENLVKRDGIINEIELNFYQRKTRKMVKSMFH